MTPKQNKSKQDLDNTIREAFDTLAPHDKDALDASLLKSFRTWQQERHSGDPANRDGHKTPPRPYTFWLVRAIRSASFVCPSPSFRNMAAVATLFLAVIWLSQNDIRSLVATPEPQLSEIMDGVGYDPTYAPIEFMAPGLIAMPEDEMMCHDHGSSEIIAWDSTDSDMNPSFITAENHAAMCQAHNVDPQCPPTAPPQGVSLLGCQAPDSLSCYLFKTASDHFVTSALQARDKRTPDEKFHSALLEYISHPKNDPLGGHKAPRAFPSELFVLVTRDLQQAAPSRSTIRYMIARGGLLPTPQEGVGTKIRVISLEPLTIYSEPMKTIDGSGLMWGALANQALRLIASGASAGPDQMPNKASDVAFTKPSQRHTRVNAALRSEALLRHPKP